MPRLRPVLACGTVWMVCLRILRSRLHEMGGILASVDKVRKVVAKFAGWLASLPLPRFVRISK